MDSGRSLEVSFVHDTGADDDGFVAQVVDLVNRVYAEAERGLWRDGANRTDGPEVAATIRAGQLAVARLDGHLVGAVKVQRLDDGRGEFGMLVASPDHRGVGIGRQLVAFAERWARAQGLATMRLELLVPQTWTHPVKEFLRAWYTRIGYRRVRTGRLEEDYPMLQPQLATPCDFVIYEKDLRAPASPREP
jgi:GNAT superfamily N-acetyltransferase